MINLVLLRISDINKTKIINLRNKKIKKSKVFRIFDHKNTLSKT